MSTFSMPNSMALRASTGFESCLASVVSSALQIEAILGESPCEDHARSIGRKLAVNILKHHFPDHGSLEHGCFADLLRQLNGCLGIDFAITDELPGSVALRIDLRPWNGHLQRSANTWLFASSVFGGLALLNGGYGKVTLSAKSRPTTATVDVVVYTERTVEAHLAQGIEFADTLRSDELLVFDQINRQINSSVELPTVLREVTRAAKQLLRADATWLYLLDRESGVLIPKAWEGFSDGMAMAIRRVPLGQFIVGLVAQKCQPFVTNDVVNDPRVHSVLVAEVARREGLRAILCVPLCVKGALLGVLGASARTSRQFSDDDSCLLSRLADQAAIAIENARLYERETATVRGLQELNREIETQRDGLRRSIMIHNQLSDIALSGRGVDATAVALAALVANPVVIQNQFSQLLTWSSGADEDSTDDNASPEALQKILCAIASRGLPSVDGERHPIRQALPDGPAQVVAAVVGENEVLGYISVIESRRLLEELDYVAIEQAATVVALQLMREKAALEVEMRLKGDFLNSLLSDDYPSETAIVQQAAYLGHDLTAAHRFLVVDVDATDDEAVRNGADQRKAILLKRQLFDLIRGILQRCSPSSLVVDRSDGTIVMFNVTKGKWDESQVIERIGSRIRGVLPEITVSIGVGRIYHELSDFRKSCEEAHYALSVLRSAGHRGGVAWFERLGLDSLFFQLKDRGELSRFIDRTLGPLMSYDKEHHTRLIETLDCYLQSSQNLRRTARALHVHGNTLLYRLQRIRNIAHIDLEDPAQRLHAELAAHLLRVPAS